MKKVIAAAAVAAAGACAAKWVRNYRRNAAIRREIPGDVVSGFGIMLADNDVFENISNSVCMAPCCYTPLSEDEIEEYGFRGGDSTTPFTFGQDT